MVCDQIPSETKRRDQTAVTALVYYPFYQPKKVPRCPANGTLEFSIKHNVYKMNLEHILNWALVCHEISMLLYNTQWDRSGMVPSSAENRNNAMRLYKYHYLGNSDLFELSYSLYISRNTPYTEHYHAR